MPSLKTPQLRALLQAKLKESGLSDADGKRLQFTPCGNAQRLHPSFYAVAAFQLPYFDLRGKRTAFYRVRYLESTLPEGSFVALTAKKEQRYSQPPVTLPEVYLPPLVDWAALSKETETSLVITEGELKAACACKLGIPTVGLGGVWSWKSNKAKHPLLPVLAQDFKWKGRTVYLCYDSDAAQNPDVLQAEGALAKVLGALGAVVRIARLPSVLPDGKKTGLDDFLVQEGKAAFAGVLAHAPAFGPLSALYDLNSEVAYARDPGLVLVLASGQKLAASAFKEHAYANRYFYEEVLDKQGNVKMVKAPAAKAWLGWEQRHEVARLTYNPGEPRITAAGEYNYWRGWGVDPVRGDVSPWRQLLDFLFRGRAEDRTWFERWCAYPLQHPGAKLYTAAVLWGTKHGTGKSLVGYTLMSIYGENATEISDDELGATHNEWAENKQFVMGDDVTSNENKREVNDKLKFMITRLKLRLNPKYVPSYTVPDRINYYFTSNHPDAFYLEDEDRRMFIHEVPREVLPREFYKNYLAWWRGGGTAHLFYHLLHLPLGDFDPQGPALVTVAKQQMQELGLSDLGAWVRALKADPDARLRCGDAPLSGDLFTPMELLALYDPEGTRRVSANGIGRELRKAGFGYAAGGVPVRTRFGQARLYALRNGAQWEHAAHRAAAEHYEQSRGADADAPATRKPKY